MFKSKSATPHQRSATPDDDTLANDENGDSSEATSYYVDEIQSTNSISGSLDHDRSAVPAIPTSKSTDETDPMNNNHNSWMTTPSSVIGNNSEHEEESTDFGAGMGHRLRHIDSGEIGWWENDDDEDDSKNDNDDTLADDLTLNLTEASDTVDLRQVQLTPPPPPEKVYRIKRIESGEKAWWMDDSPSNEPSPVVKPRNSPLTPLVNSKLSHVQSGERAWWLSDTNDESEKQTDQTDQSLYKTDNLAVASNNSHNQKRGDSSERTAWWLGSDSDSGKATSEATLNVMNKSYTISRESEIDDNDEKQRNHQRYGVTEKSGSASNSTENSAEANGYRNRFSTIRHVDSGEKAWWMQDESDVVAATSNNHSTSDSTATTTAPQSIAAIARDIGAIIESSAVVDDQQQQSQRTFFVSVDYDELGDRASPEGLEDTSTTANGRQSPYENVNAKSSAKKLFISRHTNIDDLLGGSCHPLSPLLMERFSSASPPRCDPNKSVNGSGNDAYQEISAAQVRIHDSTAQMPEIRRMHADG